MPPLPRPHRVTFLAPLVTLAASEHRGRVFAELLQHIVYGHLVDHPIVSMTDVDDRDAQDAHGFGLDANHPELGSILGFELGSARREEVLWLEMTLVPGASAMPRLHSRSADGNADVFTGGEGVLSNGIEGAIANWLETRRLPDAPTPLAVFTADEVRACGDWLDGLMRQLNDPETDAFILTSPPSSSLSAAALRALARLAPPEAALGEQIDAMILDLEPDNVIAQQSTLARQIIAGDASPAEARRLLATASQWSKLHLLVAGDGSPEEELRHAGLAATLSPESVDATTAYASSLLSASRPEEARREATRARTVHPTSVSAYTAEVRALRAARRSGAALARARHGWTFLDDLWQHGDLPPADEPALRRAQHALATTHVDVGRLDDAVAITRRALENAPPAGLDDLRRDLQLWENDPLILCAAHARDGWARRDPGRTLEGYGHGRPLDARDAALLVEALIALGREELAGLAWAHVDGAGRTGEPLAWLAGAKALLLAGDLAGAETLLRRTILDGGAARIDGAVNRVLRMYAMHPAAEWDRVLASRLDAGGTTMARLLARDLGDFVPGAAAGEALKRALPVRARRPFDPGWLDPLRQTLGVSASDAIDGLFTQTGAVGSLEAADVLVGRWPDFLNGGLSQEQRTGEVVWTLAQALCRYFALSTGVPMPLGGGLRQVACDALGYLERQQNEVTMGQVRALLECIEPAATGVDPWIFDGWVLRLERALDIEGRVSGHFGPFTSGLPVVAEALRGPERIGFELRLAHDLKDDGDPTNDDMARVLFERSLRACGTSAIASGWSEVPSGLPPVAALDIHCTTSAAAHAHPTPHLNLARALFVSDPRGERALAELLVALPLLDGTVREQRLAEIKPQFTRAALGIPFDWTEAQDEGLRHLAAGRGDKAARCFRWCNGIDPRNTGMLKNLGLAYAQQGLAAEAVAAMSGMDEVDGPKLAGHALLQAGHAAAGATVLRYASLWFTHAEDWLTLGNAAFVVEDDDTAVIAFSRAHELRRGQLAASELVSYAGALVGLGDFDRAEAIADQAVLAAGADPAILSSAHHTMARALLGQGRVVEALPHAQQALAANPLAETAPQLAETLSRAQRGEPYPIRPQRAHEAGPRAFAALAAGDARAAASIAGTAPGWSAARAALVAAAVRTDPQAPVNHAALRAIAAQLDGSAGATDRDAVLWRVYALALREDATFSLDAPPPLGTRLERSDFYRAVADRLAEDEPTIMKELTEMSSTGVFEIVAYDGDDGDEEDQVVFPGTKIPRLSDYVLVMKAMRGQDPLGTLARLGLDMASYAQLASQWGHKLATDPVLSARFTEKMST